MIDDERISEIVAGDVISFSGVSRFPGATLTESIQNAMRGSQKSNPAIKISSDDDTVTVSCDIIVYFGVNIPQLCYDIQMKVKQHVEEAADITVKAVNIRVEGIDKAPQDPQGVR